MKRPIAFLVWLGVALAGAWAYATLALHRGERINSAFILIAAVCTYAIGYRFYSKWIAARILALDDRRATPCEVHDDGKDFVKTNKWIVFGHHFAAISGPGPLVGPVLAAQFGYLPGTLWILLGVVLGGAVQDLVILFCSIRRNGKSLGQMVKEELNSFAGVVALVAILAIMIILLAVLALVVVRALAGSPWGVFTVGATIPIALFMGGYLRWVRAGRVMEASVIGVGLLLLAVGGGQYVHSHADWSQAFTLKAEPLAWTIIGYGLAASVLPVWLLLAPRDYLSTFMKLGTIFALVIGVFAVLPDLQMPAVTKFVDGSGLVVAGKVFPFCFITIACGAISGFHTLIASGTTPKMITREGYARPIGYGAMLLESLVAIMAMVAACTLDPGVYLGMNVASSGPDATAQAASINQKIQAAGAPFVVQPDEMNRLADQVKEKTLFNRAGGAATLAVGMAQILSQVTHGRWLGLWYHFAIMFEALFILTTLDAGTRVGRYILQDFLGNLWKPLADTRRISANVLASGLMVVGWGYFLIQGVRDPLGGINSLWPLFGIANQMLAAIALCLATTVLLKATLLAPAAKDSGPQRAGSATGARERPRWVVLVTFVPLVWLLAVTFTAGAQKIWHPDPQIGFLAQARQLQDNITNPGTTAQSADPQWLARKAADNAVWAAQRYNNLLDAFVAGVFLVLVGLVVLLSLREWILLLSRKRRAELREAAPVWLPDYALAERAKPGWLGLLALALGLAKELSGEAAVDRAQQHATLCAQPATSEHNDPAAKAVPLTRGEAYVKSAQERFAGVRRCC